MADIVFALISGLLIGLIYALMASGLNIIYGVMRIINFAHGNFLILGSYTAFWLWQLYGINPVVSLVLVIPLFLGVGVLLYYLTVPRLLAAENTEMMSFLMFFGLSMVMAAGMRSIWGSNTRAIASPYPDILPQTLSILGKVIPTARVLGGGVALVVLVFLVWFLYRTYYGKAIRAMIQNREATKFLGIDTNRVSALSFALGIMLAGIAGVLLTMVFPAFSAVQGQSYTIIAFSIIVLGGLGDPIGAVIGGIAFAVVEQVAVLFLPLAASSLVAFVVLVAIIMLRPEGLFQLQDVRNLLYRGDASAD
jgi:branched-chain amino acid transport system permease protein